jgi:hypothetical protein
MKDIYDILREMEATARRKMPVRFRLRAGDSGTLNVPVIARANEYAICQSRQTS